jgi:hypothetical protein
MGLAIIRNYLVTELAIIIVKISYKDIKSYIDDVLTFNGYIITSQFDLKDPSALIALQYQREYFL